MPYPLNAALVPSAMAPLERPALGAMIACIASLGGTLEREFAGILTDVMEEHSKQALAMYLALSGSQARKSALLAAAKLRISEEDYTELIKLYKKIGNKAWERNIVIHGAWAIEESFPDALLLCDPGEYAQFEAAAFDLANTPSVGGIGLADEYIFHQKLQAIEYPAYTIYKREDFIDIIDKLAALLLLVHQFRSKLRTKYRLQSPEPPQGLLGTLVPQTMPKAPESPDQSSPPKP